jgi:hypothetical protein
VRLFVVGNINAGKSFVVNKLKNLYPNYPVLSIDEYRKQFADGTIEKEEATRKLFADDIVKYCNAIIEFSGGSTISSLFVERLRMNSVVVLEVKKTVDKCIDRLAQKDFSTIPYPKYSERIEDTIKRLDEEFAKGAIDQNFKETVLGKLIINSNDDLKELPLKQYEQTIHLVERLEGQYSSMFAFGTMGRRKLNRYSDVDLFLWTQDPVEIVQSRIISLYPNAEIILQKNQIAVFNDGVLIEINVIKELREAQLFYKKSEIRNVRETVLLGDNQLIESLQELLDTYKDDFRDEFIFTMERLKYYVNSLPRISLKGDLYKYYFHSNIVVHEYLKLSYFLKGFKEYSYLPKNAHQFLSENEWGSLLYSFGNKQKEHYNTVKELVEELIEKANKYLMKL